MAKYYFVGTYLPPLSFENPPELTFVELEDLMRQNLSPKDFNTITELRSFFDILNLRAFWQEEELDPKGTFDQKELSEALGSGVGLPDYVYDFITRFPKVEARLHAFPFLIAKFFQEIQHLNDHFVLAYMNFERELRLVLTAFRAKKLGRDLNVEFQYENPEEDLIAQILAQQNAKNYEPPEKYQALKGIFQREGNHPLALQKAIDEYRLEKIDHLVEMTDPFSIERIIAYFIQFVIVEKWFNLDSEKGLKVIDTIMADVIIQNN